MDINFSENIIFVSVKKTKKSIVTVLDNIPNDKISDILSSCKSAFGCYGRIVTENGKESLVLQGDQKLKIDKAKPTIFNGFEIKVGK